MGFDVIVRAAVIISDAEGTIYAPGAIRFSAFDRKQETGKILEVGPADFILPNPEETVLDLQESWLIPGLVQSHVHMNQTLFRGLAERFELLPWLQSRIWPLEAAHSFESVYISAKESIHELLLGGTTAALTMETTRYSDAVFQACFEEDFCASVGTAIMDIQKETIPPLLVRNGKAALEETLELNRKWYEKTRGRLRANIAPRFVLSCSEEILKTSALASKKHGLAWHTHVSENRNECDAVKNITGMDNAAYFDSINALHPRSVLAHGVWLTPEEMDLLAEAGATIVHCPSANMKLGSGIADTLAMQKAGINIAIGADGVPCNNRLDGFEEMRLAALLASVKTNPSSVNPADVFSWATVSGAKAIGMENCIGKLQPDFFADMVAVDPGNVPAGVFSSKNEIERERVYAHLVYGLSSGQISNVWLRGNHVVKEGKLIHADRDQIRKEFLARQSEAITKSGILM